jgi:hypothetical protein
VQETLLRLLPRTSILAIAALLSATVALAQEAEDDEAGAPAEQTSGIDWSVGLRGSYAANSLTGGKPSLAMTPEASLTLGGESSVTTYAAGSELIIDGAGQARVSDLHAGVTSSLRLGATTTLAGSLNGELTQADPDSSGLPVNTLIAPLVFDGTAQGIATQDLGRIDARLTLDGARRVMGKTTLDDLSTVDNSDKSYWQGGATLRLGYELTPLLSTFVEGEASVQKFDAPDPTLLKYLDGRTYQLRAGVSFVQGSIINAEASIGRGWLDYLDGTITDTQDWVYNASLTVKPDETVSLTGALETTLEPSTSVPGDTDVGYLLSGAARYEVNPWLTLRASSSWNRTITLGTGDNSWGLDAGVGLDYRSSRHVVWTADYTWARDYAPPTPLNDTHAVSVGVRVNR